MAKLAIEGKDNFYPVEEKPLTIGRFSECDIVLQDHQSSKKHCEIGKENGEYYIKDLNSFNGTYVNEERILSKTIIKYGDTIKIGKTKLLFFQDKEQTSGVNFSEISKFQPSPKLIIKSPKQKVRSLLLHEEKYSIGRKAILNDICIKDPQISSQHAQLLQKEDGWWIYNLKSRNGVFVNKKLIESCLLKDGDNFRLGDTLFLFQYPRKEKFIFLKKFYIPLSFLILFCLFFLFLGKSFFQYKRTHVVLLPGNLIEDFSFEGGLSWECHGGMQIIENMAMSGKSSLFYSSQKETSYQEIHESQCIEHIRLDYGKIYSISTWLKYKNLQGIAGLRILWFCKKQKLFEEYSPLVRGDSEKWTKIEFSLYPPPCATSFQLVCFAIGKAESLYFDDIYVSEKNSISGDSRFYIENPGINFTMDSKGIFQIYHQLKYLFSFGRFNIWEEEDTEKRWVASQEFSSFTIKKEKQNWVAHGIIYNLRSNQDFPVTIECKENKEDIHFTYILKENHENKKFFIEYIFPFPDNFVEPEKNTISRSDRVILSIPGTKNKIGFFYPKSREYRTIKDSQYIRFCYPIVPEEKGVYQFEVKVKTNFKEDISKLEEWKGLAQRYYQEKQSGKSFLMYETIMENLIFHPFASVARQRGESLKEEFQKDFQNLSNLLQHAQFFQHEMAYNGFLQKCQENIKKWEGLKEVQDLEKILMQAKSQKELLQKDKTEKEYFSLLNRAENFKSMAQNNLSLLFYEEILETLKDKDKKNFLLERIQEIKKTK